MLLLPALTHAQSGVLAGKALDAHQTPLVAAKVYLQRVGDPAPITTSTDSTGVYRFTVPAGNYTLRLAGEAAANSVLVVRGKVTTVNLALTQAKFFDEPQFTVAGVTDNTYRGGHGSDTVLRSSEDLAKATASLASKDSAAESYEHSGHPLEAVRELQRAAEADPSERNLFDWGTELLSHRAAEPAREVFAKGAQLFPTSVRMLLGLATAYYANGSYEQAAHRFFQAVDLVPSDPNPYLFLGKVQANEVIQSAGYEERMARFARLQPSNPFANYYYAMCLWNAHRPQEAKTLFEKAVTLNPHLAAAYLQIGIVDALEHQYPDAIAAYRKAITEDPELAEAYYRLSEAYRIQGDSLKAQEAMATYSQVSKQAAEKLERERREVLQFVIALRQTNER